ncbi:MAG: Ig-like domain-containing protein [Bacteroidales bacterium]|nr:Ig-like domain-containing protein [Bacteroidales bacterium]
MKRFSRILCIILTVLAISCQKEKEPEIVKVTGVTLNSTSLTLTEGESQTLSATVSPQDAANKKVIWSTSNASVASVDNGGKVTASAAGSATITVTTDDGGKTATCVVTVKAAVVPVTGVTLEPSTLEITVGDADVKLTATVAPDNATDKTVSWSSDKTDVATVDTEGSVHAVAPGTATITVTTTDGGKTATCKVTVLANIDGALSGLFSVSNTRKVRFSQGNLQATYSTSTSKYTLGFAANQYSYIGNAAGNTSIDSQTDGAVVDLFGWSTASTTYGISTSTSSGSYSGDFVDWGKAYCEKNNITPDNTWRTLSRDEWKYLFNTRTVNGGTGAGKSYSIDITYGGIMGVVLYPDDYTGSVLSGTVDSLPEGVVFLPATGYRDGSNVRNVGNLGIYWSSTAIDSNLAYYVYFYSYYVYPDDYDYRYYGISVRLITESK